MGETPSFKPGNWSRFFDIVFKAANWSNFFDIVFRAAILLTIYCMNQRIDTLQHEISAIVDKITIPGEANLPSDASQNNI